MTEPTSSRHAAFPTEHEALRQDVGWLGAVLGRILTEQGGLALFEGVETARRTAIARRSEPGGGATELAELLAGLDATAAAELARAFSSYFSLVNLAEWVHRIRRRRAQMSDPARPQPGSLAAVTADLAAADVPLEDVRAMLTRTLVTPVFTAHPTEAIRRTVLAKEQTLARLLVDRLEHSVLTPPEARALDARVAEEVAIVWQTDEHLPARPTVADEAEHVSFYLSEVVYRIIPPLYEALEDALDAAYGPGAGSNLPFPMVRFGTWVGGDMDGNPNVGPDTVIATLERQRELVVGHYRGEVRQLFDLLSQSSSRVEIDTDVIERAQTARALLSDAADTIPERYAEMPYRVLLWRIWERLGATLARRGGAYPGPGELGDDLASIADSLHRHRGEGAGLFQVRRLQRRLATFGFHLATLDIRQDALVHRRVVGELLGEPDFAALTAQDRYARLRSALGEPLSAPAAPSDEARRTIDTLSAIATARERFGAEAIGLYIISMASGADDVLAVLALARAAGLEDRLGRVALDVAPLLETVDDLTCARTVLEEMLAEPHYRRHLAGRDDEQVVMLGYSDSSKFSGIAPSRWSLYCAQQELVAAAETAGVGLTLFHGRGGTAGRGGSKPRSAILAEPPGAIRGRLRLTEQGEIIHAKYGLRGIAERTLELMIGAVLEASLQSAERAPADPAWAAVMTTVAGAARGTHYALVHTNPDFLPYFRAATPIDVIERLPIGSRPASRRSGQGLENLRAIPWVFAWTQSRHLLPGWFGVGSGLAAAATEHGDDVLAEMARSWPFFTNLLADVEMVLAKADLDIARHYADLAGEHAESVWPVVAAEFERTRSAILRVTGHTEVLEGEPLLARSIRLRNPYVDPMSLLQVDLLRRWRATDRSDRELERALFTTVRGIARGLQSTG